MTKSIQEFHAQNAINEYIQKSCVFLMPGVEGQKASGVGSGIIISTKENNLVILTADHIAKPARDHQYRLGYFWCSNPISNFVDGIIPSQSDIDVALLILKDEHKPSLERFAIKFGCIPTDDLEVDDEDVLILSGYPFHNA